MLPFLVLEHDLSNGETVGAVIQRSGTCGSKGGEIGDAIGVGGECVNVSEKSSREFCPVSNSSRSETSKAWAPFAKSS